MGSRSRDKGARGEREFCSRLASQLGVKCLQRNLEQSRSGGHDLTTDLTAGKCSCETRRILRRLNQLAIEVKRHARAKPADIAQWWQQACRQAGRIKRKPMLAYREDYGRWQCMLPASTIMPLIDPLGAVHMDITLFAEYLRYDDDPALPEHDHDALHTSPDIPCVLTLLQACLPYHGWGR